MKFWYDKDFKGIICEPNCVDEWLAYMWAIGCDYDGCHSAEDLKKLIDELVDMAQKARKCLHDGKIFEDENESSNSLMEAQVERKRYEDA
jgi:hypothetical protein